MIELSEVKKQERRLNDYIVQNGLEDTFIYENLGLFCNLTVEVLENFYGLETFEDYDSLTKMTWQENLELVKKYNETHGIELDLDKLINDGTINFIYDESKSCFGCGTYFYNKEKGLVDVGNSGLIEDGIALIHELSHYKNQVKERTAVGSFLTETLAMTEEFIYGDFITGLGYSYDAEVSMRENCRIQAQTANDALPLLHMAMVYKKLGSLSVESYKMLYNTEAGYEKYFKWAANTKSFNPVRFSWCILGICLASYMYLEYKKDHSYMQKINLLHQKINETTVEECLTIIGLPDLCEYTGIEKIDEVLKEIRKEIDKDLGAKYEQ